MFFESRFGLIAWVLLNATFLLKAYQSNNGSIPSALILVSAFQFLYVADGLWYEVCSSVTLNVLNSFIMYHKSTKSVLSKIYLTRIAITRLLSIDELIKYRKQTML